MKRHGFTLIVAGVAKLTPRLANALFDATHGDIEFGILDGVALLEFTRSAPTMREAILSAIRDMEDAKLGVRVIRVESEASSTIAKINAELYETITQV